MAFEIGRGGRGRRLTKCYRSKESCKFACKTCCSLPVAILALAVLIARGIDMGPILC